MQVVLVAAVVLAQLAPSAGAPLVGGAGTPSEGTGVLVKMPRSFGMSQRMMAQHGTQIYKLDEWKAVCSRPRHKPAVSVIDRVLFEDRRGDTYVVRTVSGDRQFPLACRVAPVRGRFTLIFVDPGQERAPGLAARTPDYVVP